MSSKMVSGLATHVCEVKPQVIYVPHEREGHSDHAAAFQLVQMVLRNLPGSPDVQLYTYEVWSPLCAQFGVDVTSVMNAKLRALSCHKMALSAFDYVPMVKGLAAYRSSALLNRLGYAEAFANVSWSK
jgi:LmbE family N-acetylglucosaminyl deacetylase